MTADRDEADRVAFAKKLRQVHTAIDEAASACKPCDNLKTVKGFQNDVLCEILDGPMTGGQQTMIGFVNTGSCSIACVQGEKGTLFIDGRFKPSSSRSDSELGESSHDNALPSPSGPGAMSV